MRFAQTQPWLRLLAAVFLLFGAAGADCITDLLREASEELNQLADELNGDSADDDLGDFFDSLFD